MTVFLRVWLLWLFFVLARGRGARRRGQGFDLLLRAPGAALRRQAVAAVPPLPAPGALPDLTRQGQSFLLHD